MYSNLVLLSSGEKKTKKPTRCVTASSIMDLSVSSSLMWPHVTWRSWYRFHKMTPIMFGFVVFVFCTELHIFIFTQWLCSHTPQWPMHRSPCSYRCLKERSHRLRVVTHPAMKRKGQWFNSDTKKAPGGSICFLGRAPATTSAKKMCYGTGLPW